MEAIDKGLSDGNFFTVFDNNVARKVGTFDNDSGSNEYCYDLLLPFLFASFKYFKDKLPDEWNLGKEANGLLAMNTGIYALLRIYSDVIDFLTKNGICNPKTEPLEVIMSNCRVFYDYIIRFYQKIDDDLVQEIKTRYGSSGSTKHWRYFQKAIHDENPNDFNPEGFDDWWADNSKEFNDESRDLLTNIEKVVREKVMNTLEDLNGPRWKESLPLSIKTKHTVAVEIENDKRVKKGQEKIDTWFFITLSDYATIATFGSNWIDAFKEIFTRPDSVGKKIKKQTNIKWLVDMGKYKERLSRRGTSITRSEYEYIKAVAEWLCPECMDDSEIK